MKEPSCMSLYKGLVYRLPQISRSSVWQSLRHESRSSDIADLEEVLICINSESNQSASVLVISKV